MKLINKSLFLFLFVLICNIDSYSQLNSKDNVLIFTINNFHYHHSKFTAENIGFDTTTYLTQFNNDVNIDVNFSFGKIKNNHLLSYGLNVVWQLNSQSAGYNSYAIMLKPFVSYCKIIKISKKLYSTPYGSFGIGYSYFQDRNDMLLDEQRIISSSIQIYPFSLTYCMTSKTNLLLYLGSLQLNYNNYNTNYYLSNTSIKSKGIELSGFVNHFSIGIQRKF